MASRPISLRRRLLSMLALLLFVLFVPTALGFIFLQRQQVYREARATQSQSSRAVALTVATERAYQSSPAQLGRVVDGLHDAFPDLLELHILDGDGKELVSRRWGLEPDVWRDTVKLDHDGKPLGVVKVIFSNAKAFWAKERVLEDVGALAVGVGLVGLLVAVLISGAISTRVTGGLSRMAAAMARVQRDDLTARVDEDVGDLEVRQMARSFNDMVDGLARAHFAFARYVSRQVAADILGGKITMQLSGERRRVTVLFTDLRDFTPLAADMSPEQVVELLNQYFSVLVDAVFRQGGTIDKYIGDALMAVFNAPNAIADHERAAVRAAFEMRIAIRRLNVERLKRGKPVLKVGIGVHAGEVVAGNIGSPERIEYTVVGDTVNVAQRIEAATKGLFTSGKVDDVAVLCSGPVARASDDGGFESVGAFELKGKRGTLELYLLSEAPAVAASAPAGGA